MLLLARGHYFGKILVLKIVVFCALNTTDFGTF